jgi:hypothetical protein
MHPRTAFVATLLPTLLLLPVSVFAQSVSPVASPFAGLSGQLMGLALVIVIAPLLAVLAHKYLPELEQKVAKAIDSTPFFQKHERVAAFAKLFCHDLDLELINLTDTVVAHAKAEGKFDPALAAAVKADAIDSALRFVGQTNRDELAKTLGFEIPGALDEYLGKLLEGRLAVLKAQGIVKQPGAQVVQVTIPAPTPVAPVASVP